MQLVGTKIYRAVGGYKHVINEKRTEDADDRTHLGDVSLSHARLPIQLYHAVDALRWLCICCVRRGGCACVLKGHVDIELPMMAGISSQD